MDFDKQCDRCHVLDHRTEEQLQLFTHVGSGGEWFADSDSLTRRLHAELSPGVTVLIKGSRINRLERVVQAVTGGGAGSGPMTRAS